MASGTIKKQLFKGMQPTSIHNMTTYNESWIATEDCWAIGFIGSDSTGKMAQFLIDTKAISAYSAGNANYLFPICVPIRKGQVVQTRNEAGQRYDISFYKAF